ncbi:hypothetical protein [Paenibacillus wynnii]|uniref:Uncharacterized protein n=1 Tax=Paenibacillus wynnii TaxID=268407 RepID=A0A098MDD0_9BACL|nr:hypothetical protein [Paenibacillus wynnii]KGE20063.1 hypothetical protein PWYN_12475 [Paenibacillus wynnii]
MIKKAAVVVVVGLVLMAAFAILIYPTPYRYLEFRSGDRTVPVKTNVITGESKYFMTSSGWITVENNDQ